MKKIVKNFAKIIEKINGKLVWIGLEEEYLLKRISHNKNIYYCDLLNGIDFSKVKNKDIKNKDKNLSIKDFRKYFKKKNIDYLVADIKDIDKYLPRFIPDSIYICSNTIYIYGDSSYDYERIVKRYKRYGADISVNLFDEHFCIEINSDKVKNKFFKDKIYYIFDNIIKFIDMISDLIVS